MTGKKQYRSGFSPSPFPFTLQSPTIPAKALLAQERSCCCLEYPGKFTEFPKDMAFKYALCSEVFSSPLDETISSIAEAGFDGIEIAPFNAGESVEDVSSDERAQLRQQAADAGLEIVGLHWLLVSPPGLHLTTGDSSVREQTSAYLKALAQFCSDLGGKVMIFGSPKQRNLAEGDDRSTALERAAEVLREVGRTCEDLGVQLLLEALSPMETNFIQTIEEALELRDAIDSPGIGYMLDCKAMSSMPAGIEGTILQHGKEAGHFHANQPDGKGPGMGEVEFEPILSALKESGYEGWVSTEPFDYKPDPMTVARTALSTLREAAGS
jgi:sugar phosphate isomerase/epimerase